MPPMRLQKAMPAVTSSTLLGLAGAAPSSCTPAWRRLAGNRMRRASVGVRVATRCCHSGGWWWEDGWGQGCELSTADWDGAGGKEEGWGGKEGWWAWLGGERGLHGASGCWEMLLRPTARMGVGVQGGTMHRRWAADWGMGPQQHRVPTLNTTQHCADMDMRTWRCLTLPDALVGVGGQHVGGRGGALRGRVGAQQVGPRARRGDHWGGRINSDSARPCRLWRPAVVKHRLLRPASRRVQDEEQHSGGPEQEARRQGHPDGAQGVRHRKEGGGCPHFGGLPIHSIERRTQEWVALRKSMMRSCPSYSMSRL